MLVVLIIFHGWNTYCCLCIISNIFENCHNYEHLLLEYESGILTSCTSAGHMFADTEYRKATSLKQRKYLFIKQISFLISSDIQEKL